MRRVYRILFGLHVFVGIGAMAGGLAAITSPMRPFGMPVEVLKIRHLIVFLYLELSYLL